MEAHFAGFSAGNLLHIRSSRPAALSTRETVEGATATTLLMIVQQPSETDIAAMIGLLRRGWAVSVIINTLDINEFARYAGPLIAERIDVMHLADEDAIMDVCRKQMTR